METVVFVDAWNKPYSPGSRPAGKGSLRPHILPGDWPSPRTGVGAEPHCFWLLPFGPPISAKSTEGAIRVKRLAKTEEIGKLDWLRNANFGHKKTPRS